jgi:hypothetical protein
MKKQLLSLAALTLFAVGVNAQGGTWVPQATGFPNISTGVFNISVADSATVWISSYDGSGAAANYRDYSMTIDGGATWIPGVVPAPVGYAWSQIFGLDNQTAWAVMYNAVAGAGGGVWKTTDGGVLWTQQGVGTIYNATSFPDVVHFWDANTGFTMGDPNSAEFEIYTTADGGTTWVPVPGANIPDPLAGEYGIVNHYQVLGNTIWFDTNKGRVYKSVDQGLNWTVSSTGITVPSTGAIDIVFWSQTEGLARLYNGATGLNTIKRTTDGGATWTTGTATGNMFGNDIEYVPGTTSRIVTTGAATGFIGSSYSDDGGLTWTDIETSAQRTALGIWDINTMWSGGFTTSPSSDGIYKYESLPAIACGDPSITAGVGSATDSTICPGDTLFFTTSGAVTPSVGATFGWSIIVSTTDISGSTDPINQPGVLGGTGVVYPVPSSIGTTLVNDGSIFPAGVYYFTPVAYGNATGTGNVTALTLDPACTYTGVSVMITLYAVGDPACAVGINELNNSGLSVNAYQTDNNQVNLTIGSNRQNTAVVSIYDLSGRIILSENVNLSLGNNKHIIDATSISSGTYVVRVNDGSNIATSKLVRY